MREPSPPVHLCLVGDQPIPNLAPALDRVLKPRAVILAHDSARVEASLHLEAVLGGRGIRCQRWLMENPGDPGGVRQSLDALLSGYAPGEICLNAGGGDRVLAMLAFAVFRQRNLPVFCVDSDADRIVWMDGQCQGKDLTDSLELEEYLRAHGVFVSSLVRQAPRPELRSLTSELVEQVATLSGPLTVLNALAGSAEGHPLLLSDEVRFRREQSPVFERLFGLLENAQLLRREQGRLRFRDEASRFFVNGGWLEEHVLDTLKKIDNPSHGIRDCAMSVRLHTGNGSKNEIDVALLWNNRLHLIECKTRWFDPGQAHATQALYKMETLRDIGGLQTKPLLVSFQKLPNRDRQRAADLGIKTIEGSELINLEGHLRSWIFS